MNESPAVVKNAVAYLKSATPIVNDAVAYLDESPAVVNNAIAYLKKYTSVLQKHHFCALHQDCVLNAIPFHCPMTGAMGVKEDGHMNLLP